MEKPYHIRGLKILDMDKIEEILSMLNENHWNLHLEQKDALWQLMNGEQVVFVSDNWDMIYIFICGMGLGDMPVAFVDGILKFRGLIP
ncbi:MAG: hypothetical protein SFZ02_01110 [bacterium]|nr:hypothetical protein [bacterium]